MSATRTRLATERGTIPDATTRDGTERREALLVGVPLALLLVLPWSLHPDRLASTFAWTLPFQLSAPLLAAGFAGVVFIVSAFSRPLARWRGIAAAGATIVAIAFWLLEAVAAGPEIEIPAIKHLSFTATRIWVLLLGYAAGAELAMHRRPRSRGLAVAAALGWAGILAAIFLLPLGSAIQITMTPAVALYRLVEGSAGTRYDHLLPLYVATGYFGVIALIGLIECLRRVGLDRKTAAGRAFRSGWLGWALFLVPMLFGGLAALGVVALERPKDLTKLVWLFALGFGPLAGSAFAWRTILEGELLEVTPRRVLVAIDVILIASILGIGLWNGFHPDERDVAVGRLSTGIGQAVEEALTGEQRIDARFLGDYPDFDLRAARDLGAPTLPEGARVELVALRVSADTENGRRTGYALTLPDGRVRWVAHEDAPVRWEVERWREALGTGAMRGYGAAIHRLQDAGCLLMGDDAMVRDPGIAFELGSLDPVCHGSARLRTLSSQHGRRDGVVDRYLVSFITEDGEHLSVGGPIYPHPQGRVWLGPPRGLPLPLGEEIPVLEPDGPPPEESESESESESERGGAEAVDPL